RDVAVHGGEVPADARAAQIDLPIHVADVVRHRHVHCEADLAVHDAQLAIDRRAFAYADGAVDAADVARIHPRAEPDATVDGLEMSPFTVVRSPPMPAPLRSISPFTLLTSSVTDTSIARLILPFTTLSSPSIVEPSPMLMVPLTLLMSPAFTPAPSRMLPLTVS